MAVNKPEQASNEMTKVLKSIADTIDGKSNTDCAATSEISKWTKYVGNKLAENDVTVSIQSFADKLAENSGSGGGSGVEVVKLQLRYNSDGNAIYFTDMNRNYISERDFFSIASDETKLVLVESDSTISVMINVLSPIISLYSDSKLMTMKKITYNSPNNWTEVITSVAVSSSANSTYTKNYLSYAEAQV